jgi:hypothetical protein
VNEEFDAAQEWCAARGIQFQPYCAFFADYQLGRQYLEYPLPENQLDPLSRQVFLDYVDDLVRSQPKDWACPQWNQVLALNHRAEVLLCCVLPDGHSAQTLGSIFELTRDEVLKRKKNSAECDGCMSCGQAYWMHHPQFLSHRDLSEKPALALV